MKIVKSDFGKLSDGATVNLFTLTNAKGVEAKISSYGGTVVSLKVPDRFGKLEDIVLGFETLAGYTQDLYMKEGPFFGAIIGRFGNRIDKGRFSLEGKTYTLATNNAPNHLHGGVRGFDKVVWEGGGFQQDDGIGVRFRYVSKDMEEGYPGNLTVEVVYTLTNDNALEINYTATTDKITIINLTNHSYFNLTGNVKQDIRDHKVVINAEKFVEVAETLIPTGNLQNVAGTPMDFRTPKAVGKEIDDAYLQLQYGKGYDNCWVLGPAGEMKLCATVFEPISGRFMEVLTTEPGVQFYTGNWLNGKFIGKEGRPYEKREGLCLETQHFPDTPNQPSFPSVRLAPGETYKTQTNYKFSIK